MPHSGSPAADASPRMFDTRSGRFDWYAATNAVLAAVIVSCEVAALGLAMAWGVAGLLHASTLVLGVLDAPVVAGCLASGVWMYRSAYAAERENRAEWAARSGTACGAPGPARPARSFPRSLSCALGSVRQADPATGAEPGVSPRPRLEDPKKWT